MQCTEAGKMSYPAPSHQFASAANAQARRIPPYVAPETTPPSSKSGGVPSPPAIPELPPSAARCFPVFRILNRNWTDDRRREAHQLIVRQEPGIGKVFIGKEKDRKPIDPPPVIQLTIDDVFDPHRRYLHSPYYFMSASVVDDDQTLPNVTPEEAASALGGTLVSSLHKVKDITGNGDVAFFVFGDLSCKLEGWFKIKFTLFEVRGKEVEYIKDITSHPFQVYSAKTWPGMAESTAMTRMLSDQGIRLRLRKEPRFRLQPQGPASDDYSPRRYAARRSKSNVDPETRRESHASTMAPTPQGQSDGSAEQSVDHADEEQQYIAQLPSPNSPPLAPQPIQPMASFIADSRKRELSMSSYHGTPPPGSLATGGGGANGGAGGHTEPLPKRTRPDVGATQPAVYGPPYGAPDAMDPNAAQRLYHPQDAMQMYPPGQLGPPQAQFSRQPAYSHGPASYMALGRPGSSNFDFHEREAISMSPYQQRGAMMDGMTEQQFQRPQQQHQQSALGMQFEPPLQQQQQQQQGMLNEDYPPPSMGYPQMMQQPQQRIRQSMPARSLHTSMQEYEYDTPPVDPALDPLLAGQGHQQKPQGMPRIAVPGGMGQGGMNTQPPQYYGANDRQTPQAQQEGFYPAQGIPRGMGMQPGPESGVGFRGQMGGQQGVGFREPYVGADGPGSQENTEGEMGGLGGH